MAEGLVNALLPGKWQAYSAGTRPSTVSRYAIQVMAEIGIDISRHRSKSVEEFLRRTDLDLVVTVCDNAWETCPVFLSPVEQVHFGFEDPALYNDEREETALPKFREIRDKIKETLIPFLEQRG